MIHYNLLHGFVSASHLCPFWHQWTFLLGQSLNVAADRQIQLSKQKKKQLRIHLVYNEISLWTGVLLCFTKKTPWQCNKWCSLIVHPGGTPRNSWWGCADRSSKSWHNFRLKHAIPHTPHFQTSPHKSMCSDRPPYSVALKRQQDRSKSCLHILPDCSFVWVCFVQVGFISFNGWINRWNVIRFIAKKCFCYKFSQRECI